MSEYKVSASKDEDGNVIECEYVYRGVLFERRDNRRGYWGHYQLCWKLGGCKITTATRKAMLDAIDLFLDKDKQ